MGHVGVQLYGWLSWDGIGGSWRLSGQREQTETGVGKWTQCGGSDDGTWGAGSACC